jgi:hypothetical protein
LNQNTRTDGVKESMSGVLDLAELGKIIKEGLRSV